MQSETIIWAVAILLSLLVHSLMFIGRGAQIGAENATVLQAPLITRLSFNKPSNNTVQDEPRPIKKIVAKPVKKKTLKKEPPKRKLVKQELVKKKPVEQKKVTRRPEPLEKIEPVSQMAPPVQVRGRQVSHSTDGLLKRERQQYLYKLLSHIESFKFYPRAARRRALEGNVKISFMLSDDGYCEQLNIDGGHTALVKAARQALESAMPLPVPAKDIELPRQIEFVMVYSLTS